MLCRYHPGILESNQPRSWPLPCAQVCYYDNEPVRNLWYGWQRRSRANVSRVIDPALQAFVAAADGTGSRYYDNYSKSSRSNVTSFSISDILHGDVGKKEELSGACVSKKPIMRPWDEAHQTNNDISKEKTHRGDDNEEEEDEEIVDTEVEEDDEEIDVGEATPVCTLPGNRSNCPLDALLRMTSRPRFDGKEKTEFIGDDSSDICSIYQVPVKNLLNGKATPRHHSTKKRRKTRTAFTNHQIFQLEKRFIYQKYLTPADRDEIAMTLHLSNAQVITWFQNRRAKLKRDLEELKADVTAAKALGTEPSITVLNRLDELLKANDQGLKKKDKLCPVLAAGGGGGGGRGGGDDLNNKISSQKPRTKEDKVSDDAISTTV